MHGFLHREQLASLMKDLDPGTFLLRLGSQGLVFSVVERPGVQKSVVVHPADEKGVSQLVSNSWAKRVLCRRPEIREKEDLLHAIHLAQHKGYVEPFEVNLDTTPPPEPSKEEDYDSRPQKKKLNTQL